MMHDDFDYEWIVRDNKELEEKLPFLADEAVKLSLDLEPNEDGEQNDEDVVAFIELMREHLDSFEDMTQPEVEYAIIQTMNEMPHAMLRGHEEFDEKLPLLARIVIEKKINYLKMTKEEPDTEVVLAVLEVMKEHLECFEDMNADQLEAGMHILVVACEITEALASGALDDYVEKTNDGKYVLKKNDNDA